MRKPVTGAHKAMSLDTSGVEVSAPGASLRAPSRHIDTKDA